MRPKTVLLITILIGLMQVEFAGIGNAATSASISPKILITEVNFKNSENDFFKFKYIADGPDSGNGSLNLKGYSFQDDKIFKTIETDFLIEPGQTTTLFFKKNTADQPPNLYSDKTGLTATTEQLIILDKSKQIVDAVCWASSTPAKTEIKDLAELYKSGGWNFDQMENCVPSDEFKANQSIVRKSDNDTNSKEDWEPIELKTETKKSLPIKSAPETTTSKTKTTAKSTTKPKATPKPKPKSSAKPSYQNGDLSPEIIISEFMPNPKGTDTKNEWIELYNKEQTDVNLGNWQLDDIEGGSKPYLIPDTTIIKAKEALLIKSDESKLSLGNTQDQVRLFNFKNELIDSINYEDTPEGQSYASITITKEDGSKNSTDTQANSEIGLPTNFPVDSESNSSQQRTWLWLKDPTPGQPNPEYLEVEGEISNEPDFGQNYSFEIKTGKGEIKKILFSEAVIAAPLAKISFQKGAKVKIEVTANPDQTYDLKKYEIIALPTNQNPAPTMLLTIIGCGIVLLGVGAWILKLKLHSKS